MEQSPQATRTVAVIRVRGGGQSSASDNAAAEEPLEIRLHRRPFAVLMRTPGEDRELAAGFLLSERVIRHADDVGAIRHCTEEREGAADNVVDVTLADPSRLDDIFANRRNVVANSACGFCGKVSIDSLASDADPISVNTRVSASSLTALAGRLRRSQAVFEETGGLHAAGLFSPDGDLIGLAEDVGRHNAVDKVVGRMLISDALPLSGTVLFVSGRTSFEIVQKAVYAGVPILASVSAPSSLAIELAIRMGVTLAGFVRGDSFNIYSHARRIQT
jgi:FdhD protein